MLIIYDYLTSNTCSLNFISNILVASPTIEKKLRVDTVLRLTLQSNKLLFRPKSKNVANILTFKVTDNY